LLDAELGSGEALSGLDGSCHWSIWPVVEQVWGKAARLACSTVSGSLTLRWEITLEPYGWYACDASTYNVGRGLSAVGEGALGMRVQM